MVEYRIIIPARYGATRLPGKPLRLVAGKPLIEHVYRRALKSRASEVLVATDDSRVAACCETFGANTLMTDSRHASGTDRLAECVTRLNWPDQNLVVNLQGDEPEMPARCLDQVAQLLSENPNAEIASLWWPIADSEEHQNPDAVKVVVDNTGGALYFSRAAIPNGWLEGAPGAQRHIGLYAYRVGTLKRLFELPQGRLEQQERLEQLRWMEAGYRIVMAQAAESVPPGIDSERDLAAAERQFSNDV